MYPWIAMEQHSQGLPTFGCKSRASQLRSSIPLVLLLLTALLFSQNLLAQRARIQFKEESVDFGTLQKGEKASHVFEFTNTGDAPLKLFDTWGD